MLTIREKLQAILWATHWKQSDLAERLETTQATVSRWFSGSDPRGEMRDKINELYDDVVNEGGISAQESAVPIMGRIGAGAVIHPEYEQVPSNGFDLVHLPFQMPDEMIAFEVKGDSMLPVYKDGHVVIVYREQKKPLERFYGEEAVVLTADGRRYIKTIMRGSGGVNLMSWNAAPMENVDITWIGEIFAVLPRSSLRTFARDSSPALS